MKGFKFFIFYMPFLLFMLSSCKEDKTIDQVYDNPEKGIIHISVDESFKPVIIEQIKVYQASYPEAKIIASYKPEAQCFRDLQNDSVRMIIVAKGLTAKEALYYKQKLFYKPQWDILAYDAVSVIINQASADSVFTLKRIKKLLTDSLNKKAVIVDGKNATSTVRYLIDSVLKGASLGKNVKAANGSREVIDYLSKNEDAIGFVGSSWVGNDEDPEQVAYAGKIRLALLECKTCESNVFAKPSQATISYGQYPLVRPLYYILKENTTGLGTGFRNFMSLERGQLIFKRAYLVPSKINFGRRTSNIKE
jgi:phosphate transport system substrate-binding protein